MITSIASSVFLVVGTAFMLIAAVGLIRLPDLFTRMHAITKAGTMGVGCVMIAVMFSSGEAAVWIRAFVVMLFVALTAPVAAHMISRAAYRSNVELWPGTFVDHLHEHLHGDQQPDAHAGAAGAADKDKR